MATNLQFLFGDGTLTCWPEITRLRLQSVFKEHFDDLVPQNKRLPPESTEGNHVELLIIETFEIDTPMLEYYEIR